MRMTRIATAALALMWFAGHAPGQTLETIVNNGPSANRVDIVFLGDGYTQANLDAGLYDTHINNYLGYMFGDNALTDPFYRYRNYFNVHAVNVVSAQSGADNPGTNTYVDTALDASYYWGGGPERLLYVSTSKANTARNTALSGTGITAQMQFVTVNSTKYGGGGGSWAVFAGGNSSANDVALHEMGHSFAGLADEYSYGGPTVYTGSEPYEPNVTTDPTGSKWSQWIGYNQPGIGTIGTYEGARYSEQGIYRPSDNSKMRSLNQPFDAISREEIILDIYNRVDPLDSWTPNIATLTDPGDLLVSRIDAATIDLEWFVDDQLIATGIDAFDLADFGFGPGQYDVTARGYDPTGFDPVNGWVRRDSFKLEQYIDWTVILSLVEPIVGDFNNDGQVNQLDLSLVLNAFGRSATPGDHSQGEWTGDGLVDVQEVNLVLRNWTGDQAPVLSVPEPGGLMMVAGGALIVYKRRRVRCASPQ